MACNQRGREKEQRCNRFQHMHLVNGSCAKREYSRRGNRHCRFSANNAMANGDYIPNLWSIFSWLSSKRSLLRIDHSMEIGLLPPPVELYARSRRQGSHHHQLRHTRLVSLGVAESRRSSSPHQEVTAEVCFAHCHSPVQERRLLRSERGLIFYKVML